MINSIDAFNPTIHTRSTWMDTAALHDVSGWRTRWHSPTLLRRSRQLLQAAVACCRDLPGTAVFPSEVDIHRTPQVLALELVCEEEKCSKHNTTHVMVEEAETNFGECVNSLCRAIEATCGGSNRTNPTSNLRKHFSGATCGVRLP